MSDNILEYTIKGMLAEGVDKEEIINMLSCKEADVDTVILELDRRKAKKKAAKPKRTTNADRMIKKNGAVVMTQSASESADKVSYADRKKSDSFTAKPTQTTDPPHIFRPNKDNNDD